MHSLLYLFLLLACCRVSLCREAEETWRSNDAVALMLGRANDTFTAPNATSGLASTIIGMGEDYEETTTHSLFTDQQATVLSYLHYTSAPLSTIGSFVIIYSILTNQHPNQRPPFRRLMLGLSVNDFITSVAWVSMVPWASPKDQLDYVAGAHGNFATCSLMGFFINFQVGASFYSAFLALYFLFQVRFEMTNDTFVKWIEPVFHLIGILSPLLTGAYALYYEYMNPLKVIPGLCWVQDYPLDCSQPDSGVECIRGGGGNMRVFSKLLGSGTIGVSFLLIMVSMVLLIVKVYQTERRMHQYGSSGQGETTTANLKRTMAVGTQALLYIGAYLTSFLPVVLLQIFNGSDTSKGTYFFVSGIFFQVLNPLQGFSNALVYLNKSGTNSIRISGKTTFFSNLASTFSRTSTRAPSSTYRDSAICNAEEAGIKERTQELEDMEYSEESPEWSLRNLQRSSFLFGSKHGKNQSAKSVAAKNQSGRSIESFANEE